MVSAHKERFEVEDFDQRVILHNVSWEDFEAFLAMRGDAPSPRIKYLEGELELMSPSRHHEHLKSWIGRLVETYAEVFDIEISPYGSWLLKNQPRERGAEPDECYVLGLEPLKKDVPDLAIEVVWTSGGLDELEIYRGLGVGELWWWKNERIEVFVLRGEHYVKVEHSELLPDLDLDLLLAHVDAPSLTTAKRRYRAALTK